MPPRDVPCDQLLPVRVAPPESQQEPPLNTWHDVLQVAVRACATLTVALACVRLAFPVHDADDEDRRERAAFDRLSLPMRQCIDVCVEAYTTAPTDTNVLYAASRVQWTLSLDAARCADAAYRARVRRALDTTEVTGAMRHIVDLCINSAGVLAAAERLRARQQQ